MEIAFITVYRHIFCLCKVSTQSFPAIFVSVLSEHCWQTPAENSKWIPAVQMIYGVYTDLQLVRNTSDTVYTTRHVCCEIASPFDIIWALLSLLVCVLRGD